MRRAIGVAGMILLGKRDLLRAQAFCSVDRGPRNRRVTAPQKLLVYRFVAASAIAGGQFCDDHKTVMLVAFLVRRGLMTIQTSYMLRRVRAHLVLMNYGILLTGVTLRAFAGRADGCGVGLLGFRFRPRAVKEKSGHYEGERNYNRDKNIAEQYV